MRWRRNTWLRRGALALTVVLLCGGGYVLFWLRSPEHRVSKICGGMLPADATVGMIFGLDELKLEDRKLNVAPTEVPELSRRCKANNLWVTIEPATGADRTLGTSTVDVRDEDSPVPLGEGWTGFVARDGHSDTGAVLLDCANWGGDKGEGLFITIKDSDGASTDSENLTALAGLLTGVAGRAAGKTGCEAERGAAIEKIAPLPPETPRRMLDMAGTCRGMTSRTFARETAAGTSPVEFCDLGAGPRGGGLVLSSRYGPYAVPVPDYAKGPAGITSLFMWGSAPCGGVLGTARYVAAPKGEDRMLTSGGDAADVEPPSEAELADLARFAKASAARHGCDAPVLPSADDA